MPLQKELLSGITLTMYQPFKHMAILTEIKALYFNSKKQWQKTEFKRQVNQAKRSKEDYDPTYVPNP